MNRSSALLIVLSILLSCEAPHNNPLDPENPANKYQYISGEIKSVSIPYAPIADVTVLWPLQSLKTISNHNGTFSLELLDSGPGWLYFNKDDYFSDSLYISWQQGNSNHSEIFLNALPVMQGCEIYSIVENRYPSLQAEKMQIFIDLDDIDNDIDSVFFHIEILKQTHSLNYNTTSKKYERNFSIYELNISSLNQLTGHALYLPVQDIFGHVHIFNLFPIRRVIYDEVLFVSPSGNEVTSSTPTLVWQPFNPGFSHTYLLEIFTSEITPERIWFSESLSDTISQFTVDVPLLPSEYFWVIWAVDNFGNRTRSKPASFKVE